MAEEYDNNNNNNNNNRRTAGDGGDDGGDRSEGSEYTSEDEGTEDYRRGGYHAVRVGDTFKHSRYVSQLSALLEILINLLGPFRNKEDAGRPSCIDGLSMRCSSLVVQKVRIARILNTYGTRICIDDGRVVSNFVAQALRKEPLTVYGDGKQTTSFQFVSDLLFFLFFMLLFSCLIPVVWNFMHNQLMLSSYSKFSKKNLGGFKIQPDLSNQYLPGISKSGSFKLESAKTFMNELKFLIHGNGKDNAATGFMFGKQQMRGLYFNQSPAKIQGTLMNLYMRICRGIKPASHLTRNIKHVSLGTSN